MIQRKTHLVITGLCIILLLLTSTGSFSPEGSRGMRAEEEVPVPGFSTYNENFLTTTYENISASTVSGWGDGFIETPRDLAGFVQLDHYASSSPVRSVDVQDHKVYITRYVSSAETIQCLNITDPTNIVELSGLTSHSYLLSGEVEGDMFFAGIKNRSGSQGRIGFYNVSQYDALGGGGVVLSEIIVNGDPTDFDVQGHFLYTTFYGAPGDVGDTFRIFDIENISNVVEVGGTIPQQALGLDVDGYLACVANGFYGLHVFEVTYPTAPTYRGGVITLGNATDCLIDGDLCYIADGVGGLKVVYINLPSLYVIGSCDTPGNAESLALQGDCLAVADRSGGTRIYDVSDPTDPRFVTSLNVDAYDVAFYGDVLVIGAGDGVYTWRIGELIDLSLVGTYSGYDAWDVRVRGDVAYVAAGSEGLVTLDVSNPSTPVLLDRNYSLASFYRKIDVQGELAVVADYGNGIHVFDVRNPANIQFFNSTSLSYATDVFIHGEVVYVANGPSGVFIYNISNPFDTPSLITSFSGIGNVTAVWTQGYHLYVASEDSSAPLSIYDITNISSPVQIFAWSPHFAIMYDIYVDGDVAYTADANNFIEVWNVTDPYNTYYSDNTASAHTPFGCWGFGPYLLGANYTAGVGLYNVTDINNIAHLSSYTAANRAVHLTVHGDYVYVANRSSLVILQLFRSIADFFELSSTATSLEVDNFDRALENATLTFIGETPSGTSIAWQMSADGGENWESVVPGVEHAFTNPGNDLRWRATLTSSTDDRTPRITSLTIDYEFNSLPSTPTLVDPGATDDDGNFTLTWSAAWDDSAVVSYLIQMSTVNDFSSILDNATPTSTSQAVAWLSNGTYYFRVCALDDDGEYGYWSNTEDMVVAIPPTTTTTPPPPNLMPLIIGAIIVVIVVLVLLLYFLYFKKKK